MDELCIRSIKRIDINELANNEQFIDVVIQATTFALRTSQKEKIDALKNAILSTAVEYNINDTKSQIFLNQINRFTNWHIKILQFIESPTDWFKNAQKPLPSSKVTDIDYQLFMMKMLQIWYK